ncbi:calcium/proton exchanger [Falsiroseomonas sp. HW251]|uniref:calcium/proton exchanger n=1 Tax=Falsiroseomonas sp. HW251 TaxID=3390998 RepID=UPI003D31DA46
MIPFALLGLVPIALGLDWLAAGPVWVFLTGAAAVAVLADWVRRGTEQLAMHVGPSIGGLLNVSFGSMSELILALFVLLSGQVQVVQAQITGSIIATSLLGLGLAALAGGIGRERQRFSRAHAGLLSTLLVLLTVAMVLPAVFEITERAGHSETEIAVTSEELSLAVSVVLLVLYAANLLYTLVTHRDVFGGEDRGGKPAWSLALSLGVMVGGTVVVALLSEVVSGALSDAAGQLGLSPVFLGVILLAVVGTAADLFAAVAFARQDRMDIALGICIGSAVQVALVVAPLLVLLSWALGSPMTLVFHSPLDLLAVTAAAITVRAVAADGETTWFEGLLLVGVYAMLGLAFFFIGPA